MKSHQKNDPPASVPLLRRQTEAVIADAREALGGARNDPTEAIHRFRVALKRWRALMRLLERVAGDRARQLRHEASTLARGLGQSRDVQAALDALADCRAASGASAALPARSWQTMSERLSGKRTGEEQASLDDAALRRYRRAFSIASATVTGWPLEAVSIRTIARGVGQSYRRAQKDLPDDFAAADAERLHEFRKKVIVFRYQIEMLRPLWPKLWRTYSGEVQKLRLLLGQINDLATLRGLLDPHQPLAPWRARLAPLIDARRTTHIADAERLARRIFSGDADAFVEMIVAQDRILAEAPAAQDEETQRAAPEDGPRS